MKKKVLLTGPCGFIFSNFIKKALKEESEYTFVGVDKIVSPHNLYSINNDYKLHIGDIADEHFMNVVFRVEKPDIIIHSAAESFVDDSIRKALPFVHSNVLGTQVVVDAAVKYGVERFIYVSTDEVYGQLTSANDKSWTEETPINPRNPYSASKAAGELIVRAAHQTHGLKYNITRCCNNYGPNQPPRNLVPKVITCILMNQPIPIHGEGKQFREWLHADDHSSAILKIMKEAPLNETYNIGSGIETTNLEMVHKICDILKKGNDLISFVKDRPGHDFRYSVDCTKIKKLGWRPSFDFDRGLKHCVDWYIDNKWYFDSTNVDNNK